MSEFVAVCRGPHCRRTIVMRDGHPYDTPTACAACGGSGVVEAPSQLSFDGAPGGTAPCRLCKGTGQRLRSHFESCPDAAMFRRQREARQ